MTLEDKLHSFNEFILNKTLTGLEYVTDIYNTAYEKYPKTTKYVSTAIGTVGGDIIAKASQGENIKLRDIAFTSAISAVQAYLYPKLISLANKIVENKKVKKTFEKIKINTYWAKAITLTVLFFPVNMLYWNYLSIKNHTIINLASNLDGAKTIGEASLPYLAVDYAVANKMDKKYALPTWSAAELGWNTYVALKNVLTK